jgi:ribosomal protein S15P/S13E
VQETAPLSSSQSSLKPEKLEKHGERSNKRSSANARVSPRTDKKQPASAYTTIVSREKLDRSSKDMLSWSQKALSRYKSVSLDSWDHFKDGVALIHLIHYCDSSIVDLEEFDMSDPLRTLEAAFDLAETRLGIPNLLDAKLLMDSRLTDRGPDLRTFILYLSHFRTAYDERHRAGNPLTTTQSILADLKSLVNRKVAQVELLNEEFQHHTDRLTALAVRDELQAERTYLQQRAVTMDKMMEMSRQLNSELEAQNLALRDQNRLLTDKITHLNRALEQEKHEKDAALAQMEMSERIKAMAELLEEPDLDKYIEMHKEEIDRLTVELTEAQMSAVEAPTTARKTGNNPKAESSSAS